jgi:hypothetical protein
MNTWLKRAPYVRLLTEKRSSQFAMRPSILVTWLTLRRPSKSQRRTRKDFVVKREKQYILSSMPILALGWHHGGKFQNSSLTSLAIAVA